MERINTAPYHESIVNRLFWNPDAITKGLGF